MVAVIGMPDPYHGEVVKAYVVPRDAGVSVDELRAHCKANLAAYKVPVDIELRDSLPQSAVGKILYRVLREELQTKA
jgi:long-chain acyl-CoA synthetase